MSIGLAIVFGMMRIINLAHGEFMVIGSYSAAVAVHQGANIWLSILLVAPMTSAMFGAAIGYLIVRHLYGRMVETMLATWGLSLFVVGVLTMIFGDTTEGVPTPLPAISIGSYKAGGYNLFVIVASLATVVWSISCCGQVGWASSPGEPCRMPTWLRRSALIPRASMR